MLSKNCIEEELSRKSISVDNEYESNLELTHNYIDVTLGDSVKVYDAPFLNITSPTKTKELPIPEEGLILKPNELYIGRTKNILKHMALYHFWLVLRS